MSVSQASRPLLLGDGWHQDRPGGLNRYLADLMVALEKLGSEPRCVVVGPAAGAPAHVTPAGHRSQRIIPRLWRFHNAATSAATGCDVIDAHFALNAFWPVHAAVLRRMPLVVHFQGPWADESAAQGERLRVRLAVKRAIERSVYRRAQRIVVLSHAFKRLLVERYGVEPWRVAVVPPGVDLDAFQPGDQALARSRLGLPDDVKVATAVRRLVPRMGLDVLLRAWTRLAPGSGSVLLIVGQGPERANLEATAARLGISDRVRFLGKVDDATLLDCYRAADLVVVPSVALEGFGLTVLEALACGVPVVASAVGGLPEALLPLDPTLVVPVGNASALAARIRGAFAGSAPLPGPDRCRRHAETFSWERAGQRHRALYADAAVPARRKLRVVYLDHCALLSGGELALLRLLPALTDVEAHVILAQDGPLVGKLLEAGVSVEVLKMSEAARDVHRANVRVGRLPLGAALQTTMYTLRTARRLRSLKPDLVHTNSLKAAIYGGLAARMVRVPAVWHIRDRIAVDYLPTTAVRLVRTLCKVVPTAVIANSQSTLRTLGGSRAHDAVVPSPLASSEWRVAKVSGSVVHDAVRLAIGTTPELPSLAEECKAGLRIGMVGRLAPWKGQHLFLEAFAQAIPDGSATAVVVGSALFGEADYERRLRRQVEDLGLRGRVQFRGFQEDIVAELARMDVMVHASITPEPFGQVVVEAMAMGLPVVAADAGGPAEIIEHDVTGILYKPGDARALALAMARLAREPILRERLGLAARERASAFAVDKVAPQIMSVYHELVS